MNCSRCDAELSDSATFCPRCGAPSRQGQPATFSYLPAGTPPWPATVPLNFTSSDSALTAQAADTSGSGHRAKPRRSMRSLLSIVATLILVPLLGAGATLGILYTKGTFSPHPTASAAPANVSRSSSSAASTPTAQAQTNQLPTPTSFKQTSDRDLNVSLKYPSDWVADPLQKSTTDTELGIHSPQQFGITFGLARLSDSISSSINSPDEVNQNNISQLSSAQDVHNLEVVSSANSQPTIGGTKWAQADVQFVDSNGNTIHMMTISVQHNKVYYNIIIFAPDVYLAEAMQKYIQPMLDSLQFLS